MMACSGQKAGFAGGIPEVGCMAHHRCRSRSLVPSTALSARRALVQAMADRQTTAVALIQSLGVVGRWGGKAAGHPKLL
jgi:hypothetical protein